MKAIKTYINKRGVLLIIIALLSVACSEGDTYNPSFNDTVIMPCIEWGLYSDEIPQNEDFIKAPISDKTLHILEYVGEENLVISYQFDDNERLASSAVMLTSTSSNVSYFKNLLFEFKEVGTLDGSLVYTNVDKSTAAMITTGLGHDGEEYVALLFSPYTPSTEDEQNAPYVELGLSVKWAKNNVGAKNPEESGGFYAWSETSTKSEYWRENYAYCNNYANQYIFNYTNPLKSIEGSQYDVAKKVMGDGWRMPTRDEMLELIYCCIWENTELNGVSVAKVTGPSGQSIYIPRVGCRKQDRIKYETCVLLWTSESQGKSDEDAYCLWRKSSESVLEIQWKAWGLPVRAVYTK